MGSLGRLVVGGATAALAVLAPGAGVATEPGDPDPPRFEHATVQSTLSISVERDAERVVTGRRVGYTIVVDNPGSEPVTATVRGSLPPQLAEVAGGGGEPGDGYVDWSVTVEPQSTVTRQLSGSYTAAAVRTPGPDRVAVTACVLDDDGQPVVCATDLAEVVAPESTPWWWWAVGGAAAVAAVVAGTLVVVRWRRRRATRVHAGVPPTVRVRGGATTSGPGMNASSSPGGPRGN